MLYNRIKEREQGCNKVKKILDPSLKTSTLFDGSQKSMPTKALKTFFMQNPVEISP